MKGKAQGEREFSHGVRTLDLRRRRYLGLTRTKLQQIAFATAINLVRVFSWLSEERPFHSTQIPVMKLAIPLWLR
jgi:hypothetical protein